MVNINTVKSALGITGTYQDATIQGYINEVKGYLVDAGVPEANITNGIIARGVSDLWNYGAGDGKLSQYFYQRAIQLASGKAANFDDDSSEWDYTTDEDIDALFD